MNRTEDKISNKQITEISVLISIKKIHCQESKGPGIYCNAHYVAQCFTVFEVTADQHEIVTPVDP